MKHKTNKVQRDYIEALALVETIEDEISRIEREYIAAHNIINPDGTIPDGICCIEDDTVFDKANNETGAEIKSRGLENEHDDARKVLHIAEEKLIEYALSIAPAEIRSTLEKGAKINYTIRKKLIDMICRLDVSTLNV